MAAAPMAARRHRLVEADLAAVATFRRVEDLGAVAICLEVVAVEAATVQVGTALEAGAVRTAGITKPLRQTNFRATDLRGFHGSDKYPNRSVLIRVNLWRVWFFQPLDCLR